MNEQTNLAQSLWDENELRSIFPSLKRAGSVAAVLMAALGALAVFAPVFTGLGIAYLITGGFIAYGIYKIRLYFKLPKPYRSGFILADGALSAGLGGMILFDALTSPAGRASMLAVIATAAAFFALFGGILQITAYFAMRKQPINGNGWLLVSGILRIVLAVLVIGNPLLGWFTFQWSYGIYLMITGIALFIEVRSMKGTTIEQRIIDNTSFV